MTRNFGFRPRPEGRKGCAPNSASLLPTNSPSAGDYSHGRGDSFGSKSAFPRYVDLCPPPRVDGAEMIRMLYEDDAERRAAAKLSSADRLEQFVGIASAVFMIALGIALVIIGLFPGWMRAVGL